MLIPLFLEECQLRMHVDHVENILCDRYFVEFSYEPICNYYERGKYGCINFHVTKLPLIMLRFVGGWVRHMPKDGLSWWERVERRRCPEAG